MEHRPATASRKENLAALAAEMMQRDGYSALGLRELAAAASMKAASLYSHFKSKDDMTLCALASYEARQSAELERLMALATGAERLHGYAAMIARALLSQDRSCLALMLAIERRSVRQDLHKRIVAFADRHASWLANAWERGQADGTIVSKLSGQAAGSLLFTGLEGAIAFSLVRPDASQWFLQQAGQLLQALGVAGD